MDTTVATTPSITHTVLLPLVLHEVEVPGKLDVLEPMTELVVERYVDVMVLTIAEVATGVLAATAPEIKVMNVRNNILDGLSLQKKTQEDSSNCAKHCERWWKTYR